MADETQVTLNESVMPTKEGQVDVSNVDIVVDGKTMPNDTDTIALPLRFSFQKSKNFFSFAVIV